MPLTLKPVWVYESPKMKRFLRLAHPRHEVVLVTGAASAELARGRAKASEVFILAIDLNSLQS